jgi:hypothetical protein
MSLAGVVAPIQVSERLVEAQLLRGPQADVVALVNWSGAALPSVRVTVLDAGGTVRVESTRGAALTTAAEEGHLVIAGPLAEADVWVLRR